MVMNRYSFHGLRVHINVPNLEGQVVPGKDVPPVMTEFDVRDRGDDLGKERSVGRILFFLKTWIKAVRFERSTGGLLLSRTHSLRADHKVPHRACRRV